MPVNGFSESTSSVMPTVKACDSAAIGTALGAADGDSSACTAAIGSSSAQVDARGDGDPSQGTGGSSVPPMTGHVAVGPPPAGSSPTPGRKDERRIADA